MITVLIDHDSEGHAALLLTTLIEEGWVAMGLIRFVTFVEVGLATSSTDRQVWRYIQQNGMILLTGNRNMEGEDSLEQTIRDENTPTSLPVVTVSRLKRMTDGAYRLRCVNRLAEIVADLEDNRGVGRLFIP